MPDLTRRDRLPALEAEVRTRIATIARDLWHIGQALREVQRDELWRDGGHASFEAWLQQTRVLGRATAYKALRVAEHFSEDAAVRLGTEKLDATVAYLNATAKEEEPGDILAGGIRVRGVDGAWTRVPYLEASAAQVRQAASDLNTTRRRAGQPRELRDRVDRLNADLPRSKKAFQAARVQARTTKAGQVLVSLTGVPLEHLEAYVAEVRARLAK